VDPLLLQSATELAKNIREQRITSREVVEAHIQHTERVNPSLHALVAERFDAARTEANNVDQRVASGDRNLPEFYGVPCTIKESFALEQMPWTAGLVARSNVVATSDAPAVQRLRSAGMIPLGVTNTSELCMWMESDNRVYGRTSSAYDSTRTAGGSSGGEGAMGGAGASPVGLGADVGGSIRMPAFFNGVFGHKPSPGLVPNVGQYPNAEGDAQHMLGTGPIVRRACDLMPVLRALAGPHPSDRYARAMALRDPHALDLRDVTVLDVRDAESLGVRSVEQHLLDAQERAADALARRGATVRTHRVSELRESIALWSAAMDAAAVTPYSTLLGNGTTLQLGEILSEIPRSLTGSSQYTMPSLALCVIERLMKRLPSRTQKGIARAQQIRDQLHALLGGNTVMLYPSHTRVAPKHNKPILWPVQWGYTAIFNVMRVPVTQVPLGITDNGLPLGVQVVGAPEMDHLTIRIALELEQALGGWVPPTRWA
jgi:fatty acid amide hydrolase 2